MATYESIITSTSGLTNYWRFQGNGNATTGSATVTLATGYDASTAAFIGTGLTADSSTSKTGSYTTGVANTFFNNTYSIEFWFKVGQHRASQQEMMRMSNELALEINTAGKVYYYYNGGADGTSTATFDDNAWHHLVVTRDGSRVVRCYIDGTQVFTFTAATGAPGSANLYMAGSQYTTQPFISGQMDEVALYNVALSSGTVTAHYNAGYQAASYTASVMTGSGTMPGGVVPVDKTVTADVMTASGSMPTAAHSLSISRSPSSDYFSDLSTINDTTSLYSDPSGDFAVMKFDALPTGVVFSSATLRLAPAQADSGNVLLYPITASWTGTPLTKAGYTLGTPFAFTFDGTTNAQAVNISTVLNSGQIYGFLMENSSGLFSAVRSNEYATSGLRPLVAATYTNVISDLLVEADPFEGSGEMPTATAHIYKDIALAIDPLTASASMPTAGVEAQHDGLFEAEPMEASAEMPGGAFTYSSTPVAEAMTASGTAPTATVSTTIGALVVADSMDGTARWVPPAEVNGEPIVGNDDEDPYFVRVMDLEPKYWWRFQDGGSLVKDTITGQTEGTPSGQYRNGAIGNQSGAPEGRKAVTFPLGSYIEQNEPTATNVDETTFVSGSVVRTVLEFSIKTNKANQFVMAGVDKTVGPNGVASNAGATELFIQGGKMGYRTYVHGFFNQSGTNNIGKEFVGFANVADDEWHHIVIRSGIKSGVRDEYGVEIWVDGKLDVRRYFTQSWIGMPDWIGGRGAMFDSAILPQLPLGQYYEGQIAEVVWYADTTHTPDDATRNYYAFFGYRPFEASAMEASATMPDGSARGNQKKALYLYFSSQDEVFGGMLGGPPDATGQASLSFDPDPSMAADSYSAPGAPRVGEEVHDYMGYKVFTKSARVHYTGSNIEAYRDNVTDEQSLIDLTRDVDLDEYDVIMFKDWPDEGYEREWFELQYPGQLDRLLQQIRDANEEGIGLFVTNPRLALDLGVIDSYEWVPALTEQKFNSAQGANALGSWDYGSAMKFPWNISSTDNLSTGSEFAAGIGESQIVTPSYLNQKALFYYDTNKNNRFRLRAQVEGLTDIPAYMLQDAVFHIDSDAGDWQGVAYKYLERMDGLQIGDEWIYPGSSVVDPEFMSSTESRYNRYAGTYATPPGAVNAGIVVTTFGETLWNEQVITTNPYKDYITTIVLESGTILNGRSTGARIFVNFSEQPNQGVGWAKQVLPHTPDADPDALWPKGYGGGSQQDNEGEGETAAQMQWHYSWTRTTLSTTRTALPVTTATINNPDGSQSTIKLGSGSGAGDRLNMIRSSQLFPVIGLPGAEMDNRGLFWLSAEPDDPEGSVRVHAESMTASGNAPDSVVTAQKSGAYVASAMTATAMMPEAEEAKSGNALYLASPMTADGRFSQGNDTTYVASPMTAEASMPNMVDTFVADRITLRLPRTEKITLRIKEAV